MVIINSLVIETDYVKSWFSKHNFGVIFYHFYLEIFSFASLQITKSLSVNIELKVSSLI